MKRRKPKFKPLIMVSSEYTHFLGNNWRKMHGIPMKRFKHLERERERWFVRFIDKWNALGHLTAEEIRRLIL